MAAEPEKKIEELLHAYSRKRREDAGAPLEMHPATRRMLQGEVARQSKVGGGSSASPRPWWKTLLLFGPKYAGAIGMFAILAVGVWVITQNDRSGDVRQETSERTAGTETPSARTLEELAHREGEKLREADELADLRAPAKEAENKKAELSKSLGAAAGQSKLQTRDADNKPSAAPAPAVPELKMTEDLAREKQVSLQKDPQVGERIANVIAGTAGVSADKNAAVLADSTSESRFYKRNEGKTDALAVTPPATQSLPANLNLAAAKPTNGAYFAYNVAPATNFALGTEVTTTLYAGVKLMVTTNAPAEGYLNFADRFGAAVTEWAAAPADSAKDQLGRAREFRQEAEWRESASPAFLRRFSVEQNDGVIRIRDAEDGSVYQGEVVVASESTVDGKAKQGTDEVRQLRRNFDDSGSAPVNFRASGINQRSRQMVIINGQLTEEQERLSAIAGKVIEPVAQAMPTDPATGIPALTPADGPSAARRDQAGAAQAQARSAVRSSPAGSIAPTSTVSRATSAPVSRATTLRARVQIGATNELNFRAVRTR
jgi:hypothetical protein